MADSVAVDAKRILLRYGAPIAVMEEIPDEERIEFARMISKTKLSNREDRLVEILQERGYLEGEDEE